MQRRRWVLVSVAASVLALVALASNATNVSQQEGQADTLLAVRKTLSQLLNTGTIWAALAVISGWLMPRPVQAFVSGVLALLVALVVHYGVGSIFGMFDPTVWAENSYWFVAAVVTGGPLGVVGAIAHRPDSWGIAARLVVPVGALLEPFVIGMFTMPAIMPWSGRFASAIVGAILLATGILGCIKVLVTKKAAIIEKSAASDC